MALAMKEKICLTTPQGVSEIQLLFGDITQLPLEEKVDCVFVSAFPGDYAAVPSSLIGALKRNLGIIVGKLAKDKEVNLLHNFNCWVSKPLPDSSPFNRLVCFERINRDESLSAGISGMFRAMMPVFNNKDTSVVTPLLAAGNQGHKDSDVLKAIVTAACHWIQAGLPLRLLKVVVYVRNPHFANDSVQKLVQEFLTYKRKWETKESKKLDQEKKKYDVCLSYSKADKHLADNIYTSLQKANGKLVIYRQLFTYNTEAVWQDQIFSIMVNSYKIVAVLTPNYVGEAGCLEQFNLALCCNRQSSTQVLAPFYIETVASFPSYMTLIQYTECRVRKEGEEAEGKIMSACTSLVKEHQEQQQQQQQLQQQPQQDPQDQQASESEVTERAASTDVYDIFISYAHRADTEATSLYETLQNLDPTVKVFFDRSELKTGNVWQEALYEAVDSAKVVVAFISQSYLQSSVCQEEYNIALARFLSQDGVFLVPVLIDSITEVPHLFSLTPFVDLRTIKNDKDTCDKMAVTLIDYVKNAGLHNQFSRPPKKMNPKSVLDLWRRHYFRKHFENDGEGCIRQKAELSALDSKPSDGKSSKTVVISFASDCFNQASYLCDLLRKQESVKLSVEFVGGQQASGAQGPRLQLFDSADMVVVIVSDDYLASPQHCNELHIALCRQRQVKTRTVLYLIQAHHSKAKPTYAHLLQHSINLGDRHWFSVARDCLKLKATMTTMMQLPGGVEMRAKCSGLEHLALQTAALDVALKLMAPDSSGDAPTPVNIINLAVAKRLEEPGPDTVPIDEHCIPFSSMNNKFTKDPAPDNIQKDHEKENEKKKRSVKTQAEAEQSLDGDGEVNTGLQRHALKELRLLRELEDLEADFAASKQKKSSACVLL